jgi:hypothetical protein
MGQRGNPGIEAAGGQIHHLASRLIQSLGRERREPLERLPELRKLAQARVLVRAVQESTNWLSASQLPLQKAPWPRFLRRRRQTHQFGFHAFGRLTWRGLLEQVQCGIHILPEGRMAQQQQEQWNRLGREHKPAQCLPAGRGKLRDVVGRRPVIERRGGHQYLG